ncbi:uncharacterized protein N7473_010470 [Penicillium subrubescens]|uniref:Uncharacterized protein n=1 Tax=Penicillium subrubescens TaxID=1316194 RepID=A0A1Q5SZS5_9EURO|nr:uncharacterized protein N7473_010470 [Penicillium subrubescens]KAJ5883584.1 hypothetical protein N7473_010470 [Penicillium subrubescens]OKO93335.1 hypothetical protein PENSUB_12398 [Penicillium subrubescens]
MGASTPSEIAPPYEELYSQRGSNSHTGYARVSADDPEPDLERDAHQHQHQHQHHHQHEAANRSSLELTEARTNANGDHVHCESCDRQLERRERQRSRDQCCATVSRTMMTMSLFLMIFGIVAVLSWRRVSR